MAEAEAEAEEEMRGKVCFVTVGTTLFDGLIRAVDETRVLRRLRSMGYSRVVMQIGRGSYEPDTRVSREDDCAISIEHYRFKPGLAADMEEADLIISHAGAGSIMVSACVCVQCLLLWRAPNPAVRHRKLCDCANRSWWW
jgi:UDP-N-acetylglucosamine transferase subunit ALG13